MSSEVDAMLQMTTQCPSPRKNRTSRHALQLGITGEQWSILKPLNLKRSLNKYARQLAKQVHEDWHDHWEEQADTCAEWMKAVYIILQCILETGVQHGKALKYCHDGLRAIGDSYRDLLANSARVSVHQMIGDWHHVYEEGYLKLPWENDKKIYICNDREADAKVLTHLCAFVWRALLKVSALRVASVKKSQGCPNTNTRVPLRPIINGQDIAHESAKPADDELDHDNRIDVSWLSQAIKDAHDNGVRFDKESETFDKQNVGQVNANKPDVEEALDDSVDASQKGGTGDVKQTSTDKVAFLQFLQRKEKWVYLNSRIRRFKIRKSSRQRLRASSSREGVSNLSSYDLSNIDHTNRLMSTGDDDMDVDEDEH